jgi:predicted dehydrogenase
METLAEKYKIHLLTNYVINRYPSNHKANEFVSNDSIGAIRKVVFRDGHRGPKKIGVSSEFLNWLTDPVKNGGGAITDFGCYGVNLMTWLLKGEKPSSVTAVTQQLQSVNNPKVDDDAMIILNYDNANALILASWNWPIERKDMEIYGLKGALYAHNKNELRLLTLNTNKKRHTEKLYDYKKQINPREDPFVFFYDVITNKVILDPYAIPSLENNMIVMEVLDAAIKSSKLNKSVQVKK